MKNNLKNPIDLSSKSDSFTSYLIGHIPTIDKKTHLEIVDIIKDSKNHASISDAYLANVLSKIDLLKHRKGAVVRYLGDIILKGSNLGIDTGKAY